MTRSAPIVAATLFIILAVLAGGASNAGVYANALIQFAAAVGIALALVTRASYPGGTQKGLLLLLIASLMLTLTHLIPLPPTMWAGLPGRQAMLATYTLAGIAPGWRPLTLDPEATIGAALAILPVIAAALIGMRAPRVGLTVLFGTLVLLMVVSTALGLAQRVTGLESSFYIYDVTNRGEAVGFFANSNHLAALCAISIPAATALFVAQRGSTKPNAAWMMLGVIILFALLGLAASNSLAGFGLGIVGLLSIYILARLRRGTSKLRHGITIAIVGIALASGLIVLVLSWGHLSAGTITRSDDMSRATLWPNTVRGILAMLPVGSGLGSFATVFPQFENVTTVTRVFANHAHNDYLETAMTGGVPAMILMVGFGAWWLRTAIVIALSSTRDAFSEAATVVTGIIMLHEIVDYPLRTAALAVVFGLCCGVMARPRRIVEPDEQPSRASRHMAA